MERVILGVVLLAAGILANVSLEAQEWAWPLNVLGGFALCLPGMALVIPPLEHRVDQWRGRAQ